MSSANEHISFNKDWSYEVVKYVLFIESVSESPAIFFAIEKTIGRIPPISKQSNQLLHFDRFCCFVNRVSFYLFRQAAILSWFTGWPKYENDCF